MKRNFINITSIRLLQVRHCKRRWDHQLLVQRRHLAKQHFPRRFCVLGGSLNMMHCANAFSLGYWRAR